MTTTRGVNPATWLGTCPNTHHKKSECYKMLQWTLELLIEITHITGNGLEILSLECHESVSHGHWKRLQWIEQCVN